MHCVRPKNVCTLFPESKNQNIFTYIISIFADILSFSFPPVRPKPILVMITSQTVIAQQQKFRVTPHDLQVLEGSEALLSCEVTNLAGQVQWTKDGFALGKTLSELLSLWFQSIIFNFLALFHSSEEMKCFHLVTVRSDRGKITELQLESLLIMENMLFSHFPRNDSHRISVHLTFSLEFN